MMMLASRWIGGSSFGATRALPRRMLFSTTFAVSFQEGDEVLVKSKGGDIPGLISEVRGSGWYSIQLNGTVQKVRASQLSRSLTTSESSLLVHNGRKGTLTNQKQQKMECPKIIDLDSLCEDPALQKQVTHHLTFKKWVVFSDLHCSSASLDTCLQVLKYVHNMALQRDAGILFLGDFWHVRGTLKVDMLNAVLNEMQTWTQPLVMIPGNHDQVTLGGQEHALTPLRKSYFCQPNIPGPLIFDKPTIFGKALFVPHMRNAAVLEQILDKSKQNAIFCHAHVAGATVNDGLYLESGIAPLKFPTNIPTYSGHFHKPHNVTSGSMIRIEYVGSPYQTSLSEAHQRKELLVLDSLNWHCTERIPIQIGRCHYRIDSLDKLQSINTDFVKKGDRVVVSMSETDEDIDTMVADLRNAGASVEIRHQKSETEMSALSKSRNREELEDLTPQATLNAYLTELTDSESLSQAEARNISSIGLSLLQQVSDQVPVARNEVNLELSSVTLQGFGPFKYAVTYPLANRGLVLLYGVNNDGGTDSNGTGKSFAAMAALWALTGTMDSRLVADARVAHVVSDGSKSARVTLEGKLNGEPFKVTRTKTSTKTGLEFIFQKDMTRQTARDTQEVMNDVLGVNPQVLGRTIFHGQHAINGLLEANDVKLKEELSCIVPLGVWQHVATLARTQAREASRNVTELNGMMRIRQDDFVKLQHECQEAYKNLQSQQSNLQEKQRQVQEQSQLHEFTSRGILSIADSRQKVQQLEERRDEQLQELNSLKQSRDAELKDLQHARDSEVRKVERTRADLQQVQFAVDKASFEAQSAWKTLGAFEEKWNVDLTSGNIPLLEIETCPTCGQSLVSNQGESHDNMQLKFEEEAGGCIAAVHRAENLKKMHRVELSTARKSLELSEHSMQDAVERFSTTEASWKEEISSAESVLRKVLDQHNKQTAELAEALSQKANDADIQALKIGVKAEEKLLQNAEAYYDKLNRERGANEEELSNLKTRIKEQEDKSSSLVAVSGAFGAKGIQNFVLQNTVDGLQTLSQTYLDELSDDSIKLELTLDVGDRITRRAFVRLPDGEFTERPLSSLSGGQWRRCSLALCLGFVELMSRRGRFRPSLLVLDEPLTHLDRSGRNRVGSLLRKILSNDNGSGMSIKTVLLILQDLAAEELEEAFDQMDQVVKQDGFSTLNVDDSSMQ